MFPWEGLSHVDDAGRARMVDVSAKADTNREAVARGTVRMQPQTLALMQSGGMAKGDVIAAARLAGIMAAKRTSELITLCHPITLTKVDIDLEPNEQESRIEITATARSLGKTGVEMEALTAVAVTALTFYDMVKAADRSMVVGDIRLLEKSGGKSGTYIREEHRLSRKIK